MSISLSRTGMIAVVADLHLGDAQAPSRMISFTKKVSSLKGRTKALFVCGDTFSLAAKEHWKTLTDCPAKPDAIKELEGFSHALVETYMPQIISAAKEAGIPHIFIIPGNGDAIAYRYLEANHMKFSTRLINNRFIAAGTELHINIAVLGGIEIDCDDARNILFNNPWYSAIMTHENYASTLEALGRQLSGAEKSNGTLSMLITHMPAFGHLDFYSGSASQGSKTLLDFITKHRPLLHLCGHVHSGCYEGGDWKYRPFSVIGSHSVSINPGGGMNHDYDDGVLILEVDIDALATARAESSLETSAKDCITLVK